MVANQRPGTKYKLFVAEVRGGCPFMLPAVFISSLWSNCEDDD